MVSIRRPVSLSEALYIRQCEDTVLMAGGTDLMVKYRAPAGARPSFTKDVVLIGHLKELNYLKVYEDVARIGAAVPLARILEDASVPAYVKEPLASIGSPSVRNLATLGGNICNSSPAGDSLTMLYALDAVLTMASSKGFRECDMADFIEGPSKNRLAKDEILIEVAIPMGAYDRTFYRKSAQRRANAISKVSFFGVASVTGGKVGSIAMALGAVGPTVVRDRDAESMLKGIAVPGGREASDRALEHIAGLVEPIDDLRSTKTYRRRVALELTRHFLEEVVGL